MLFNIWRRGLAVVWDESRGRMSWEQATAVLQMMGQWDGQQCTGPGHVLDEQVAALAESTERGVVEKDEAKDPDLTPAPGGGSHTMSRAGADLGREVIYLCGGAR